MKKRILLVDDDEFMVRGLTEIVQFAGYEVQAETRYEVAKRQIERNDYDLFWFDLQMPLPRDLRADSRLAGERLWLMARQRNANAHIVICSAFSSPSREMIADRRTHFFWKPVDVRSVWRRLDSFEHGLSKLNLFVVHGRDKQALRDLEAFLVERLETTSYTILQRTYGNNSTIIEKLEEAAEISDACVVLITPDDNWGSEQAADRMRQNVLYELGYFLGRFGRKSGRVIVFLVGEVEMPSDLHGVDFIRVPGSFEELDQMLVDELKLRLLQLREST